MTICMTNGGLYNNVKAINEIDIANINASKLKNMLRKNDFIEVEYLFSNKAILRTDCISSINFD